jgi:predicted RNA binding protein YcfA (HicA-like mRNA interferase family)
MPKKVRDLKAMLRKAGFRWRPGKGSHTIWEHPLAEKSVTIAGNDGSDAKKYLEREVQEQIALVESRQV